MVFDERRAPATLMKRRKMKVLPPSLRRIDKNDPWFISFLLSLGGNVPN